MIQIANSFFLNPLMDVLEEREERRLLADLESRFQLSRKILQTHTDVETVIGVLQQVVEQAGISDIGLRIATKHNIGCYASLGQLMVTAGIFIDVIDAYVRHFSGISNIVTPKFERPEKGNFEINFVFNYRHPLLESVLGEILLFSLQDRIAEILGEHCKPGKATMTAHSKSRSAQPGGVFNGNLAMNSSLNSLTYSAHWLSRYIDNQEKVFDYLLNKLKIMSGEEQKVTEMYELLLVVYNCLEVDHCFNQAEIANFLGFSKRTLVRRYQSINIKFTELIDIYRRRKSVDLLAERDLTINEIAYRLGFWERSTFDKKFRSWYGITPAKLKKVIALQEMSGTVLEPHHLPQIQTQSSPITH